MQQVVPHGTKIDVFGLWGALRTAFRSKLALLLHCLLTVHCIDIHIKYFVLGDGEAALTADLIVTSLGRVDVTFPTRGA